MAKKTFQSLISKNEFLALIALELAICLTFFLGIFKNNHTITMYDQDHHLYVGRGEPITWAGVSLKEKRVPLPLVRAPFLTRRLPDGSEWQKVIDLRIFVPFFTVVFLTFFALMKTLFGLVTMTKHWHIILTFIALALLIPCWFFYFLWFPRI
jgi:hypothetical protein